MLVVQTYALNPSCLAIFTAQSQVFLYFLASKPYKYRTYMYSYYIHKTTRYSYCYSVNYTENVRSCTSVTAIIHKTNQ